MRRHRAGDRPGAEALYRQVTEAEPARAAAWHGLGLIAAESGRLQEAERHLAEAAARAPGSPAILVDLAKVEHALGKRDDALALLKKAAEIAPQDAVPQLGLATLLAEMGQGVDALLAAETAVQLTPDSPDAWAVLGSTARRAGAMARAVEAFREGTIRFPEIARFHHNLGALLIEMARSPEAEEPLRRAIVLEPGFAAPYFNLGLVLSQTDRPEEAIAAYEKAAGLMPHSAVPLYSLGLALKAAGDADAAVAAFERALALDPSHQAAFWGRALTLPVVHADEASIDRWRQRWRSELKKLEIAAASKAAYGAATATTNFYLAAQGRDDRADQARFGALLTRIAEACAPDLCRPRPRRPRDPGTRVRVGFVSAYLYRHSITKTHGRFLTDLNPEGFAVTAFHLGTRSDDETDRIRRSVARFVPAGGDRLAVARAIADAGLDILFYPEIGMDPGTQFLAALRLAPVQVNMGGHPVTSGLPAADWFTTSDRMEPAGGDAHYTEKLLRLPGLGTCYSRPSAAPAAPDLPPDARGEGPVLLNLQSLFKLTPAFDYLYPRIARAIGPCRFWFLRGPAPRAAAIFEQRLERVFAADGLRAADYVRILPPQSQSQFLGLIRAADLVLDGVPWSGNNSTMESLAQGRAVVTWPQTVMRSRHTAAILEQAQVPELIARSADDFVRLVARLATDGSARLAIEARIAQNCDLIFDDAAPVRALERWIESVV